MSLRSPELRRRVLSAFSALLVLLLIGCNSESGRGNGRVSLEGLCGLKTSELESMSATKIAQWLNTKQATNITSTTQNAGDNTSTLLVYQWTEDGTNRSAFLKNDHTLRIDSMQVQHGPTFGDVVATLGSPSAVYRHAETHEKVLYTIELDYPNLGVSIGTSDLVPVSALAHGNGWAVQLKESMKVDYVSCYVPQDSMEEVLKNDYLYSQSSVQIQLDRRVSWPKFGNWITLDNLP